ncbi:hypothetical protein CDD82_3851 [Ophiocordyceps australis]|uniref:Zinc finger ZPR1-type domain-containing protein n=1 Tax=Ophiocordyceps australis TaxID=1399860 RepID=A0A2C5ZBJ1_9HYPO|nr:hypothetical protein CDD82_3851 [Ophiocordyceps australis]
MASTQDTGHASLASAQDFHSIGIKADTLTRAPNGAPAHDQEEPKPIEEIESLCMNCGNNGTTRLLLTAIPYFRQVVIMSFSCEHCHSQNNEIQAAGSLQPKGSHFELRLTCLDDMSRQIVKSDTATVKFVELDLEIPCGRGVLTNVEGLLSTAIQDLEMGQEARREQMPHAYPKVAEVIAKGHAMLAGEAFPFRLYLDDPAGNSFIAPDFKDGVGKWEKREYVRTAEQNSALGLADTTSGQAGHDDAMDDHVAPNEVYSFPASCPGCMHSCTTHMKMVDIPHFKQVVLMSTVCDDCGYRSNDVKTGGEIPPRGEKITLEVNGPTDLARDILKSETCALECPQLKLHVNPGTLGGRFTTVEGLLTQVRNDLHGQIFQAARTDAGREASAASSGGDSLSTQDKQQWDSFFTDLDAAIAGHKPFTLILTDPFASSFVQPLADAPDSDDSITREAYHRTDQEEEELGLRDMKTEGYEQDNDNNNLTQPAVAE